ncbi:PAS domain-containing protein [Hymenobacter sp. DH14]|uniref:histidine kinase n=1 Tax=Hymenobacter cyanobacteriorum TaxID=2926463 RepID=A0A9X2AEN2_9BACT|nr:PAS domain-containing protein [Hymenobacter cyanobacteriorum]MCI1186967.1 PAS domain-containing protein [Hymenobacter cyanobacteriorum]
MHTASSDVERLQTAVDAAGVGTWDFNPISGELVWSARCKEIFGLPPTAQVSYDDFLAGIHPDDRAATDAAVQQALDPAGTGTYDIEYRTRWQESGPTRWARATGKGFFDANRTHAQRFIGTITDVTDYKALLDRIKQAYEELEVKVTFRNLELEREVRQLRAQVASAGE